jgi:hypothetical protein
MSTVNVSDPTRELTRKPWAPMCPEALDALRPKRLLKGQHESPEAFAYRAGISALTTLIYRIELLEQQVRELQSTHDENMRRLDARHKKV